MEVFPLQEAWQLPGVAACGISLLLCSSSLFALIVDEALLVEQFARAGLKSRSCTSWMLCISCITAILSVPTSFLSENAALVGALLAVSTVYGMLAVQSKQLKWLAVIYQVGVTCAAGHYNESVLAVVVAAAVIAATVSLATSKPPPSGEKAATEDTSYRGCSHFSNARGLAFAGSLVSGMLLEFFASTGQKRYLLLQSLWTQLVLAGTPYVAHKYFAGAVATASYFTVCAYFTVLDVTRSSTKVQKDYFPDAKVLWAAFWPQALAYGLGQVAMWATWMNDREGNSRELPLLAPSLFEFSWHMALCLFVGDFLIYWEHRVMHMVPFLRKHIHSVHHEYTAVFSWAGGWVHPLEDAVVVACQCVTPGFLSSHPLTWWVFAFLWVAMLIDEHSGHDVWWSFYQILPFSGRPLGGGAAPHDIHHYVPTKNYGFMFCIWDHLFGTFQAVDPEPKNPYVPPYKLERRKEASKEN